MAESNKVRTFATAKKEKDALVAQLVEHLTLNQGVQGSTPCRRTTKYFFALVAQLVEHLTLNQGVQGSTPCRRTKEREYVHLSFFFIHYYINSDFGMNDFSINIRNFAPQKRFEQ